MMIAQYGTTYIKYNMSILKAHFTSTLYHVKIQPEADFHFYGMRQSKIISIRLVSFLQLTFKHDLKKQTLLLFPFHYLI